MRRQVTSVMSDFCDPMDGSLPGMYGILQVRILEWIAITFSREPIPLVRTYFNEMKTICGRDITCTLKLIASIIDHRLEGSNLIVPWWLNG